LLIAFALVIVGVNYLLIQKQSLLESIQATFLGFPVISFVLGSLIALFPFKNLNFKDRWIASSLAFLFVIESLFLVGYTLLVIFQSIALLKH
jgi:peptidoglycan/LPS O-acetylase OafA/YrhL